MPRFELAKGGRGKGFSPCRNISKPRVLKERSDELLISAPRQMNSSLFLKKSTIPFFVFVTGACVLIIEITATRILSPYFGNTIFSVSSVISVVLFALSTGYFAGGKFADKYPKEELFYGIIAASGFCVIFLHIVAIAFLPAFGYQFSLITGPVVWSVALFFLQNFLLGMLSPFAIKLQAMRQEALGIGSVSGQIFFWSTFGSIFGSLGAGFFLIPHFGINSIILSIGFLLIILGLFSLLKIKVWLKLFLIAIFIILSLFLVGRTVDFVDSFKAKSVVYVRDGVYQRINIYDGQYQGKSARFLQQDRDSSAAEFINSDELVYKYTKYYAVYHILHPDIKEALMIGGGGYSVPKALLQDLPNVHIDVAEIEPSLFNLVKQYFNVPESPRLNNVVEDGRRLLVDSDKKYDFIFSDAYSSIYSTPEHLATREFFAIAKNKLSNNGIFIANVIGNLVPKKESLALSEIKTFKSVFENSYFFAVNSPDYPGLQNIIFVGYNSQHRVDMGDVSIRKDKNPIISHLSGQQINISKIDFSPYPILTDDFAPVEYLTAKEL